MPFDNKRNSLVLLSKYIYLFVVFNAVLVTFGLPYIYVLAILGSIILCLLKGIDLQEIISYFGHLGYIGLLISITLINFILGSQDMSALVTLGLYTLPIFYWVLWFAKFTTNDFDNIFASVFIWAVIVAFFGVLQFFYSPSLWGTIPTESKSIAWAMEKPFVEYAAFFRSTSTLASPQVFGLFCALSLIIAHRFNYLIQKGLFQVGVGMLTAGGVLSGNKSFFVIVCLYMLAVYFAKYIHKLKYIFLMLFAVIMFVASLQTIKSNIPMLDRIFSFEKISEQEVNDSRLETYFYIINNSNVFIGNGMGEDVLLEHKELDAAESYIFKIYFECGLFAAIALCLLMITTIIKAWFESFQDFIIVILIFFSMVIVHAFQSPVFFIFWGYLLSFFAKGKVNRANSQSLRSG